METIVDKIMSISLISNKIKEIEKEDSKVDDFSFRKESYKKIKDLLREKDILVNEIKNTSLYILKNRLSGAMIMNVIPTINHFKKLDDIKYTQYHINILNIIKNNQKDIDLIDDNESDDNFNRDVEILNIKTNLLLIDEVINFFKSLSYLDDDIHEFLYEEVGYNLCTIANRGENHKKMNNNKSYSKYDKIKKMCFELFDTLDDIFFKINNREPRNIQVENILWD